MKVLILAPQPFFQNRGTPIAVRMLAEELQRAGHGIDLLVFHEGEDIDLGKIVIHRISAPPGISAVGPGFSIKKIVCDFFLLLKSIRLCKKKKFDMVHAVEESVFIAILLKVFFKIPYIYDIDSWLSDQLIEKMGFLKFLKPIFNVFEKAAVRNSRAAIAVCKALEEKVKKIDPTKPLLRLEDVSLLQSENICTERISKTIGKSGEIILYVGNLESYQGIDLMIQAFSLHSISHETSNLVIIGGSEKDIENYKQITEKLAISSRVFFIGPRPLESLGMYLQQADLLVSPRVDGENTPMKIYSYMASGIPVVATRIVSHTQVLNDSVAYLVEPKREPMAEIFTIALTDNERAGIKADKAKELVESNYSRSAFREKLTGFYKKI